MATAWRGDRGWGRQRGERPGKEGEGAQRGLSHKQVFLGEKRVGQAGEGAWGEVRAPPSPGKAAKPQWNNSEEEGALVILRKPGNAYRPPCIEGLRGFSYLN